MSPYISPYLPTSPHISAHLPTPPHISLHLPPCQERIILNIDVYHPELTDLECEAIALTVALKKKLFGSTQEELHESRR